MASADSPSRVVRGWPRTVRVRLAATLVALLMFGGGALLAIVYLFMRFVPTYHFGPSTQVAPTPAPGAGTSTLPSFRSGPVSIASQAGVLNALMWVSIGALLLLLVIGAWVSWVMAGRILRPLRRINRAALLAGSGSLSHRVALPGPPDEITELSDTFDSMLARLDTSFQAQRRFAANASHELQSPLSAAKAILDVAAADPGAVDVPRLLRQLKQTNRRSIETIEALLDLADAERHDIDRQDTDLSEIVATTIDTVRSDVDRHGVAIHADLRAGRAVGDPVLLRQLAANLITNAVRHNVAAGTVRVGVRDNGAGRIELTVINTGPVVPALELSRLVEPFYRSGGRAVEPSGSPRGHGLGLTLVHSIVAAHGGHLHLAANPGGGLAVRVLLPAAQPEPPPRFDAR
jgi:two-component system sensor histidine kinase VanS